ncbi:hypothetical protein SYNTR_2169 [Candidatus Syntrophocurvum alkaliphilum]|uniref:Protein translocase subunit SecE n=1 Tax=Candidatus Syntrophocurvum alkaliphilum TaxID=2293317 RepID=A0A6I6DI83_9FIRM|nr:preprotein translocase subunit SecE [Candidatus Syntrophocurvum alkaliphilum]QGU00763.1 hypothetical protein SYNTR_2169 [Candidatus Syntrophocurvum alkaliphilum]
MAKNNASAKEEKNIQSRFSWLKEFLINVYSELKKVHWPGRPQIIGYTGVVLFAVTLVAIIIWLFDMGLSFVLERLFNAFA